MLETRKKEVMARLNAKDRKFLRMLLKHQKDICRMKEDARREGYMK